MTTPEPDETAPAAAAHFGEGHRNAHSGPGWYYWDSNYPDEGSVGPFDSREAAVEHARAADYEIAP